MTSTVRSIVLSLAFAGCANSGTGTPAGGVKHTGCTDTPAMTDTAPLADTADTITTTVTPGDTGLPVDTASTVDTGACTKVAWYIDLDEDGINGLEAIAMSCTSPGPEWSNVVGTDCNDLDDTIWEAQEWSEDLDGDGFGDPDTTVLACEAPSPASVLDDGDCDDTDPDINPDGVDVPYDGIDQDCLDGDECDVDGDGSIATACGGVDCNDADPSITSFGFWILDADGDGFGDVDTVVYSCGSPGPDYGLGLPAGDCDDGDADINPDAIEVCDGIDQNCDDVVDDGLVLNAYCEDGDGDGFGGPDALEMACMPSAGFVDDCTDCDDGDYTVNPGAVVILADGIDQDCTGPDVGCSVGYVQWSGSYTAPVGATNPVVSVERFTAAGVNVDSMGPLTTIEGWTVTTTANKVDFTSSKCVPETEQPYCSASFLNPGTLYECMGNVEPFAVYGSWTFARNLVSTGYVHVLNATTPAFTPAPGTGGCEAAPEI